MELCGCSYDDSGSCKLLLRVLEEPAVESRDGPLRLRTKEDGGMDVSILQNPADPNATYLEKAKKQNRGNHSILCIISRLVEDTQFLRERWHSSTL